MQITNDFILSLPPDEAYDLLLRVDKVAPCMPGAEIGEVTDDGAYELKVTVKLGPMRFLYSGAVGIAEQDDVARRAVLHGEARETRGQGTAEADITMVVTQHDEGALVSTVADMKLTGRAAQSGRGIVEDVSKRMIAQMAEQLSARYASPSAAEVSDTGVAPAQTVISSPAPAAPAPSEPTPIRLGPLVLTVVKGRFRALLAWSMRRRPGSR